MFDQDEGIRYSKVYSNDNTEVAGNDGACMILEKCALPLSPRGP